MPFKIDVFMDLKDASSKELKILVGGTLLQQEHGMFDLHEEQDFKPVPGHNTDFSHNRVLQEQSHHVIHDPSYPSAQSMIDSNIPLLEHCLDEQLAIERCDRFIDQLDLKETRLLYEELKSKGLLSECSSGIMLTQTVYEHYESQYENKLPLEALSILIGRNLFKRRL